MFDRSRYTIGWVCAIKPELVAAQVHLDAIHDQTDYEARPNDDNTYVFGNIGKHNIVIATLPREYGKARAAGVARDLLGSFTNVRIGLMVGIGGGAPVLEDTTKQKRDIRLGDIVVGTPGNGKAGVYQYDYGKVIQGKDFLPKSRLNAPPTSLLNAVAALEADFEINGNGLDGDVEAVLQSNARLRKNYQRPDGPTDRLYKSTFVHSDEEKPCRLACNDEEQLVLRNARNEEDGEEKVALHYGLIASADTLMKDASLRDYFASNIGILCFEMEAAGLMNQLPFLVIRGICDYSDSHKSKEWQGYAAMTAAAYAKKLLQRLAPNQVNVEVRLSELQCDIDRIGERVQRRM